MDFARGWAKFKPMLGLHMWDYLTNKTDVPHGWWNTSSLWGSSCCVRAHDLIFLGSTIVDSI